MHLVKFADGVQVLIQKLDKVWYIIPHQGQVKVKISMQEYTEMIIRHGGEDSVESVTLARG